MLISMSQDMTKFSRALFKLNSSFAKSLGACSHPRRAMSDQKQLDLTGVYPPIATPFDKDENIDYGKLKFNMDKWNKIPFRGRFNSTLV